MKTILSTVLIFMLGVVTSYGQYDPDRHNTSYNAGWISCESTDSPNSLRGKSYWIMYDLGKIQSLGKVHIWNTNVPSFEGIGIKEYYIDHSIDGTTWQNWGEAEAGMAASSGFYKGEEGPDLGGLNTRFLLITAKSNHGGDCVGFSEIRIQTDNLSTSIPLSESLDGSIVVQPSAFTDNTVFVIQGMEKGEYEYKITDLAGRELLRKQVVISSNQFEVPYNGSQLSSGLYIFTLSDGRKLKSIKFEKINP